MRRQTQSDPGRQIPLPLDWMAESAGEPALLAAYRRLELSRRLSFEQVMSDRAYAIGVRNLADAIARRGSSNTAGRTPATREEADGVDGPFAHRTQFQRRVNAKGDR